MIILVGIAGLGLSPISKPQVQQAHQAKRWTIGEGPLYHQSELLYVPVSLGGNRYRWFILDTGSYRSYLTKLGFAHLKASGIASRKDGETGPLDVKVAGLSLGKASFALDTTGFPTSLNSNSEGIIGLDLLQRTRLGVDVTAGNFRVWRPKGLTNVALRDWFPRKAKPLSTYLWRSRDATYTVMVKLANMYLPACVDTGCEESYLARELAPALRPSLPTRRGQATFYTGVEDIQYYRVPSIGLEGLWVPLKGSIGATNLPNTSTILGVDVLSRLRVLFDFPGKRLYYTKPKPDSYVAGKWPLNGPYMALPTGAEIWWPLNEVVRVEPGCDYEAPDGYRKVNRPDGSIDLVPPGIDIPPLQTKPRLLIAPTVGKDVGPVDRPTFVPPKAKYTVPPGWRIVRRKDGSVELHPPVVSG